VRRGEGSTPASRAAAGIAGALVGGVLMGGVAWTHGTNVDVGAASGAVLVGLLWRGVDAGTMSPATLVAVLFALFFAMVGPGYDDYGGHAVIPAAIVGAIVGRLVSGRRRGDKPVTPEV
jgi:hypothetical protein